MKVNFVDLKAQYKTIKPEIDTAIQDIIDNTAFVLGKKVFEFEDNFSKYIGVKHSLGVNSGTSALILALQALNIENKDEVILPPNTFFATAEAVSLVGATPVFVDIDEKTYNINVDKIEKTITKKTKAIIPVHLYGQPADMDSILELAKKHNLFVIEDACQAHGAEYKGKKVGSIGDIGCFSFYPGKNLGAYGEGGMITTNDDKIAEKIKKLRDHGSIKKFNHELIGWNARLEGIQGAVLNVKLKHLDKWTEQRRKNADLYRKYLKDADVTLPYVSDNVKHVYHLFVIKVKNRDKLQEFLKENNIYTGLHYPVPIHLQPAYEFLGHKEGDFPITEANVKDIISLPMYPELTEEEIKFVCEKIEEFLK